MDVKTRDGVEIKTGTFVCNCSGEQLRVEHLFCDADDVNKLVVTPIYMITSMHMECYGDSPTEVEDEFEWEAERTVVRAGDVFNEAPSAKIDAGLSAKKAEYDELCRKIGVALVELNNANAAFIEESNGLNGKIVKLRNEHDRMIMALRSIGKSIVEIK